MAEVRVRVKKELLDQIKKQGLEELPNEACGYLAGISLETLDGAIRMRNIDASPEHFSFDPKEQFSAVKQARKEGKVLAANYHTHPETPARMSDEDIRLANDTSIIYFIYSMVDHELKAFSIDREKNVGEIPFELY